MNKGVEILLKRMESHPEEFDRLGIPSLRTPKNISKWRALVDILLDPSRSGGFFSDEERKQLNASLANVQATVFTKHVLQVLTTGDDSTSTTGGNA